MELYAPILEYMKAHRQDMVRDLCALARIPSVQSAPAPGAPFGEEAARCLRAAAKLFEDSGFRTTVYPDSGYALAEYGEGGTYIGLFAHSDVVPVNPEEWLLTAPFEPIEKDGFLVGRGVSDNKSGVIASLYLFKALRDLGVKPKHRLVTFIGSNEESGMADAAAFAREQPLPAVSLVPDSGFPVSLGERGILRADVLADRPFADVLALEGGEAYNIVLPRVTALLRAKPGLNEYLAGCSAEYLRVESEGENLRVTVLGAATHAGHPEQGESALLRLARLLADCPALDAGDRASFAAAASVIASLDGQALGIADTDPVLGTLTCANGIARLQEGRLLFTLDIRHGVTITTETILERAGTALKQLGFGLAVHSDSRAFVIDRDDPFAQVILDTFRRCTDQPDAQPYYMAGGTYCKHLPNAFALGASFGGGDPSVLNLPASHGHAHQSDEYLFIDGLTRGAALLARIALSLDEAL